MKNLAKIPDAILGATEKAFLARVASENEQVVQPSKTYQKMFAALDRLAGAYLDCLADRDEWKELGEAMQRKQREGERYRNRFEE